MNRVDGYTSSTATVDVLARVDDDIKSKSATEEQRVAMEAGVNAHLRPQSTAPVPAFSGDVSPEKMSSGKLALETMGKNVGVDYTALMSLIIKLSSEQRRSASDSVVMGVLNVADQMKVSAQDMRTGAAMALAGGVVGGALGIVGGAVSLVGGVKTMQAVSEVEVSPKVTPEPESPTSTEGQGPMPTSEMTPQTEGTSESQSNVAQENTEALQDDIAEQESKAQAKRPEVDNSKIQDQIKEFARNSKAMTLNSRAQALSMSSQGISGALQGAGQLFSTMGRFGSDMYQAQSKDDEALAQQMQAALEKEKDYGRSVAEDVKKMMDIFTQLEQSRHETQGKIADTL